MACGILCVVTDVGDSAWIVGDAGIVVPPKNPEALSAGWNSLLNLALTDRLALGEKARKTIVDKFSVLNLVQKTEFHCSLLSNNKTEYTNYL
jgi:glycosyltransferase involved in cell wall biosynthesis